MRSVEFRPARAGAAHEVSDLVRACGLPWGVPPASVEGFVTAWSDGALIGAAGVEDHGAEGLLRSVAVAPGHRGRGIAAALCDRAEAMARGRGIGRLWLLTATAGEFFARRGYAEVDREAAPAALRAHEQWRGACPADARCLRKSLRQAATVWPADLLPLRADVDGARCWHLALERSKLSYYEVEPHTRFERHAHDGEQITTVLSGTLYFEIEQRVVAVGTGGAIALPPAVEHAVFTRASAVIACDAWSIPIAVEAASDPARRGAETPPASGP